MQLRFFVFLMSLFSLSVNAHALSVSGGLGLGQTTMSNEAKETEGPLTQAWTVERLFHSRLSIGVEHLRSLKTNLTTSSSFSGLMARYYINTSPTKLNSPEGMSFDTVVSRDVSMFVGMGFGFAQSSRLPNDVGLSSNVAGLYVSPRAGAEYQLNKHLGVRGELIYATSISGEGNLSMISVGSGLYWLF